MQGAVPPLSTMATRAPRRSRSALGGAQEQCDADGAARTRARPALRTFDFRSSYPFGPLADGARTGGGGGCGGGGGGVSVRRGDDIRSALRGRLTRASVRARFSVRLGVRLGVRIGVRIDVGLGKRLARVAQAGWGGGGVSVWRGEGSVQ
jgi:hypothetical protein